MKEEDSDLIDLKTGYFAKGIDIPFGRYFGYIEGYELIEIILPLNHQDVNYAEKYVRKIELSTGTFFVNYAHLKNPRSGYSLCYNANMSLFSCCEKVIIAIYKKAEPAVDGPTSINKDDKIEDKANLLELSGISMNDLLVIGKYDYLIFKELPNVVFVSKARVIKLIGKFAQEREDKITDHLNSQERIICSAVMVDSTKKLFYGHRHNNCISSLNDDLSWNMSRSELSKIKSTQGFVTATGRFVDRTEAGKIAFNSGQTKRLLPKLHSEDLY